MVQRGYRDDDIRKILGLNVLRVARDVLPSE
jgi:microsomal dipeptidase-like Zn-dependent dipeptidase